jgi:selenide,water dikinase
MSTPLALVCFPEKADTAILAQILSGGLSKMIEANCTVIGGHSIRDPEIKFGYAVTGTVHPRRVLTNGGAKPGDALLLTKPLGTGVISTAIKRGKAAPQWIEAATGSMTTLNRSAAEVALPHAVHGMTDVTGFGLIGHARELALASKVALIIRVAELPLLSGALECVRAGMIPGGLKANRDFAECVVEYAETVPDELRTILFDPQTAGGLLIAVAATEADELVDQLRGCQLDARRIGEVLPARKPLISVV